MGFCGEMVVRRTPEKGTGGSGEGGATRGQLVASLKLLCPRSRTQAPKPCRRPLENQKKNYRLQNTSF